MKPKSTNLAATLVAACAITVLPLQAAMDQALEKRDRLPAEAGIGMEINGRPAPDPIRNGGVQSTTHSESKSISLTSDGRQTIRRTTTTRNGVTEETTEFLDENGEPEDGVAPGQEELPEPDHHACPIGVQVGEADSTLRDQLDLARDAGLVLLRLVEHGPAAEAGLQVNDILLHANDQPLSKPEDLHDLLGELEAGEWLRLEYLRKGQPGVAIVAIGEAREQKDQQAVDEQEADTRRQPGAKLRIQGHADLDSMLEDPDIPFAMRERLKDMMRAGDSTRN